jgi:UDP-N-acetylmuramyl pentapeptide phosphotransferase/UDP-N-acetylglucosamine-1-phosphate transferase
LTSFVVTYLAIPKIIHFSNKNNFFAKGGGRHSHENQTPIFGGIAISAGLLFSLLFWAKLEEIQFILVSLIIVYFIGLLDDLLSLTPTKKLIGLFFSIFVLMFLGDLQIKSFHNLFGIQEIPELVAILFTLFVAVIITNAYNLIDGIDGLAGGLGVIASFVFSLIFLFNDDTQYVILSFTLFGALLAYLKYNFNPASIFMGDTGSLVIGLFFSILSIRLINEGVNIPNDQQYINKGPFITIVILAIPLFDTFRVFFIRIFSGYHPLRPDRNHIHHALLDLGLGHKMSTFILYIYSVVIAFLSYFMIDMSLGLSIFLLSIIVLGSMSIPFILIRIKKTKSEK